MKAKILILTIILILGCILLWYRFPLLGEEMNKQTMYVGVLDALYGNSSDSIAHAMWIDDDSGEGIFDVKRIADELGIQPVFAVIADKMNPIVADSLVSWQKRGTGIVIHGLRHERWKDWNTHQVENDIIKSYERLYQLGFDTTRVIKYVIPPYGCNTYAIRQAICRQGSQMISGASLVNPDRNVFQLGRIAITPNTDADKIRHLLLKAYKSKSYVIFCTHSSIPSQFSIEKCKEILNTAKEIGFFDDFE